MTKHEWAKDYGRLCAAYGKPPSADQATVYLQVLGSHDAAVVTEAVTEALTVCKFFPSPAEIVAQITDPKVDTRHPLYHSYRAWQQGYADDPIAQTISFDTFRRYAEERRQEEWAEAQRRRA